MIEILVEAPAPGPRHLFIDAGALPDALEALGKRGSDLTVLAGGTDVMVQYLRGDVRPKGLLHIRRLVDLGGRSFGTQTFLGALTTHWQLVSDGRIRRAHPALAEAAATVGGRQTQNVGTIAGNLVNASPAADLIPVFLVSEGRVTLESTSGARELPISDFVVGRRSTVRRPDELVTRLSFEPVGTLMAETYLKMGRRAAMEVTIVGLAARLTFDSDRLVTEARIALASVGPKAFRAGEVEARLAGTRLEESVVREAGELLRKAAHPIDDPRATAAYRDRLLPGLLQRALAICQARAFNPQSDPVESG
jgi:aerobic carbon-monoxide dehydrogenase medium subunit